MTIVSSASPLSNKRVVKRYTKTRIAGIWTPAARVIASSMNKSSSYSRAAKCYQKNKGLVSKSSRCIGEYGACSLK